MPSQVSAPATGNNLDFHLDALERTKADFGFSGSPPPLKTGISGCKSDRTKFMPGFEHHIFICTNQRPAENPRGCCDPDGLGELQLAFKKELAAQGRKATVRANKAGCLDQCEKGPTVVVYPEAVWYGGVTREDVREIVESHIINGCPVQRLLLRDE